MTKGTAVAAVGPSFGPAIVTLFGIDVPVVAMALSLSALILARLIAKPPSRSLTQGQNVALTTILVIVLFLVVTGQLFGTEPLGPGMAVVWAVGLGLSGMLVLEIFADRMMDSIGSFFGKRKE